MNTESRFWRRVDLGDRTERECWAWQGSVNQDGYGHFWWNGKNGRAHRYAYELRVGPIPKGKQLDHLCRNRWCVNPSHLRVVTNSENMHAPGSRARAHLNATMTHCQRGHKLTPENVGIQQGKYRYCRPCKRKRDYVYDSKRRG